MGLYFVFTPAPGHGSVATIISSQLPEKLNLLLVPVTSEFECVCVYTSISEGTRNVNIL